MAALMAMHSVFSGGLLLIISWTSHLLKNVALHLAALRSVRLTRWWLKYWLKCVFSAPFWLALTGCMPWKFKRDWPPHTSTSPCANGTLCGLSLRNDPPNKNTAGKPKDTLTMGCLKSTSFLSWCKPMLAPTLYWLIRQASGTKSLKPAALAACVANAKNESGIAGQGLPLVGSIAS